MIRIPAHFGELLQGRLGPDGPLALVTLPGPLAVTGQVAPGPFAFDGPIDPALAAAMLDALGRPRRDRFTLTAEMPVGGGAGSSTASLVALARLAGVDDPARIAAACLAVEGASDPLMWPDPARLLWAPREGRILRRLPPPPPMEAIGGFLGPGRRTDPADTAFPDIADLIARWPEDAPRIVTEGAARTLALRGPANDPTAALAARLGATGWGIAHTGSARFLLFPPGAVPAAAEPALRQAGFAQILRFRC